jgi:3-hydroxyacyl-CoA dehydrogenase
VDGRAGQRDAAERGDQRRDAGQCGAAEPSGPAPAGCVSLERHGDIAVITADNPPVNTITAAVRAGLSQALQQLARQSGVRALLLRCAGSTFFSGADIGEFSGPPREAQYRELYGRIEALPIPVIAAMHGTVLGGGLELALACHYRVASPEARFGFPEVTLGIIPGAGGTQRMPRLIGALPALELIVSGKPVGAQRALELGFIDAIIQADAGDPLAGALAYVGQLLAEGAAPRRTGERRVDPASAALPAMERLKQQIARQYPHQRAPALAFDAVSAAVTLPLAQGLSYEEQLVAQAKISVESRAAVHLFFAEREARRVADLPPATAARPIQSCAVVGAGTMGRGIAECFANAGIPVTLLDVDAAALGRGLAAIAHDYASQLQRGRISAEQQAQRLALVRGSLDDSALSQADLIIEAAFEDLSLKRSIFERLDRAARPGAVLATNTSTLDIGEIARATRRPGDVIGMHFFMPAQVMPLLEVVRTAASSPETIQTTMQLARRLRKTPVIARLCYGFIGNRMMEGYAREAERMVLEGAAPRRIDSALEQWGMAMGILAVFDMAGIDVSVNVHRANAARYPPDPSYYQADMALAQAGRLGRKSGTGYYRYQDGDATRHDDPEALALLRARAAQLDIEPREHSEQEIVERCLYPLINEGFRILQEGVAQRAGDIDVVWCAGYGFPRYRGGPLFYAESIGLAALLDALRRYRERFGPMHWEPAPLLVELVASGRTIADWERERGPQQ